MAQKKSSYNKQRLKSKRKINLRRPCLQSSLSRKVAFLQMSKRMGAFIGVNNSLFLAAITDFYDYLWKKGIVKEGILYYSGPQMESTKGITRDYQEKALRELPKLSLLKGPFRRHPKTNKRVGYGQTFIKINETAAFLWTQLLERIDLGDKADKTVLRQLFKMILRDERFQKIIRKKIARLNKEWFSVRLRVDGKRVPENVKDGCDEFEYIVMTYFNRKSRK